MHALRSVLMTVVLLTLWAGRAPAQSFFPPALGNTSAACSQPGPGLTATVTIDGTNGAFYRASSPSLVLSNGRLVFSYRDGCGLLTVVTNWQLTASLAGLAPGTYPVDALALPDSQTCDFTPLGPTQIGTVTVPPLPCLAPQCIPDVAHLGGTTGPDGQLTPDDVILYLSAFFAGNLAIADIASLGGSPTADGQLTADDLILFLDRFFAGCGI